MPELVLRIFPELRGLLLVHVNLLLQRRNRVLELVHELTQLLV